VQLTAQVRRQGRTARVPVDQVVPGDIVLLSPGSRVPADGRVLSSAALQVDESPLTGESFPAEKQVDAVSAAARPADRRSAVFLGTHVVGGVGEMVALSVGADTELGRLSSRLASPRPPTSFDLGLQRFGYLLLEITAVLVVGVFAVHVAARRPALDALLFATALAVGIIPELLPAIVTVTLARGARRMAARDALVKHLPAIENLGTVDVLCSDKTGTLTEGRVTLAGAVGIDGAPSARALELGGLNATFESGYDNPLDAALRAAWPGPAAGWQRVGEVGYDFVRKRLSVLLERDGRRWLVTKGQLAKVLEVCTHAELPDGTTVPLDQARERIAALHDALASEGQRALGVAVREVPRDATPDRALEAGLVFAGVLGFADPPKADTAELLSELAGLGVVVKLVTGDDRRVAAHLWSALWGRPARVLTGDQVGRTTAAGLDRLVRDVDVFAEVEPHHKERIVAALKRVGHAVAYLGDGINDAAALHAADVGLTVDGAADVAREAADVVLQRPDLRVLAEAIREGRRTMARTLVYVRYTTSANFGNMLSMAVASIALPFLPLLPKQILLNNLLSDVPTVAIVADRVDDDQIARPGTWSARDVRRFMFVFGTISSVFDLATFGVLWWLCGDAPALFQTGWFVESLLTELAVLLVLRTRRPVWRSRPARGLLWLVVAVSAVAVGAPYTPLGRVFGLVPLPAAVLGAVLAITVAYAAATEAAKWWFFRDEVSSG
jgi:Mg2+-importing ATPase